MGADGSNPVQLTNDYFCAHAAAWFPDGTKISYNGIDGSQPGMSGIKLMNADASQDMLLGVRLVGRPEWRGHHKPPSSAQLVGCC
jgi:hypothetical protein